MNKALTVAELAEYLGLAKDTVYRKVKAGEIPGVRIGRIWRFPQDLIDEWLRRKAEARGERQEARGGKRRKRRIHLKAYPWGLRARYAARRSTNTYEAR